ncbi:MAG: hypothetical protein HC828_03490 [Blastochloris sp.]|nr:hypothetical protein [Blastochloris sp.]
MYSARAPKYPTHDGEHGAVADGRAHLELPVPAGRVPITVSGGSSQMVVRRAAGIAARVQRLVTADRRAK